MLGVVLVAGLATLIGLVARPSVGGVVTPVNHAAGLPSAGADASVSFRGQSADGQVVAFTSTATNLVAGFVDGNGSAVPDLYLWTLTLARGPADPGALVPRAGAVEGVGVPR